MLQTPCLFWDPLLEGLKRSPSRPLYNGLKRSEGEADVMCLQEASAPHLQMRKNIVKRLSKHTRRDRMLEKHRGGTWYLAIDASYEVY